MIQTNHPTRSLACGALGGYDRDLVLAIARRLDADTAIVHEDDSSILAMDRDPIRWAAQGERGFAWSERIDDITGSGIRDWRDASSETAACGLVVGDRSAYLHSSVAGIAPIYFLEHEGAVYFATTVDALALSSASRLSVDWEAWASTLALAHPLGDRTPFAEIRRLPPFSRLEAHRGTPVVTEERWPWAEIEPTLDVEAGVEDVIESLRASVGRMGPGPITCQLSGGLDSRLCLALLDELPSADVSALTVDPDTGNDREIRIAATIAEAAGVPHQVIAGEPTDYWSDLERRALRVDYQFARAPWRMPKLATLRERRVVVDGFGFDVLAVPGDRFFFEETLDPRGGDSVVESIWDTLRSRRDRRMTRILRGGLGSLVWSSAHRQFMDESERFRGHPARAVLTFYRTREVRGIACAPYAVVGADVRIAMPLIDDQVARGALAISPLKKRGGKLYDAVFERLSPQLLAVGTSRRGGNFPGERIPRRGQSGLVSDALHASIVKGPLAPWVRPRALQRLTRHHRGKPPAGVLSVLSIAMFHQWCERYRHLLGEIDPAEGFGIPHPSVTDPD